MNSINRMSLFHNHAIHVHAASAIFKCDYNPVSQIRVQPWQGMSSGKALIYKCHSRPKCTTCVSKMDFAWLLELKPLLLFLFGISLECSVTLYHNGIRATQEQIILTVVIQMQVYLFTLTALVSPQNQQMQSFSAAREQFLPRISGCSAPTATRDDCSSRSHGCT